MIKPVLWSIIRIHEVPDKITNGVSSFRDREYKNEWKWTLKTEAANMKQLFNYQLSRIQLRATIIYEFIDDLDQLAQLFNTGVRQKTLEEEEAIIICRSIMYSADALYLAVNSDKPIRQISFTSVDLIKRMANQIGVSENRIVLNNDNWAERRAIDILMPKLDVIDELYELMLNIANAKQLAIDSEVKQLIFKGQKKISACVSRGTDDRIREIRLVKVIGALNFFNIMRLKFFNLRHVGADKLVRLMIQTHFAMFEFGEHIIEFFYHSNFKILEQEDKDVERALQTTYSS